MKPFLLILFIIFAISNQYNYYISPFGNDETGRGTAEYPWKTLKKAYSATFNGDAIIVGSGAYVNEDLEIAKRITIEGEKSNEYNSIFKNSKINITTVVTLKNIEIDPSLNILEKGEVSGSSGYIKANTNLYVGKDAVLQAHHVIVKNLYGYSGSQIKISNLVLQKEATIEDGAVLNVNSVDAINAKITFYGSGIFDNATFRENGFNDQPFVNVISGKFRCDNCKVPSKLYGPAFVCSKQGTIAIFKSQFSSIGRSSTQGEGGTLCGQL